MSPNCDEDTECLNRQSRNTMSAVQQLPSERSMSGISQLRRSSVSAETHSTRTPSISQRQLEEKASLVQIQEERGSQAVEVRDVSIKMDTKTGSEADSPLPPQPALRLAKSVPPHILPHPAAPGTGPGRPTLKKSLQCES
mmetsp:Transcript_13761/g.19094  ORF Transcript_13761/g.19094 Transcript_13761/m.19094 type:complete len:140 (-) Transcript_13761:672-1091(-)